MPDAWPDLPTLNNASLNKNAAAHLRSYCDQAAVLFGAAGQSIGSPTNYVQFLAKMVELFLCEVDIDPEEIPTEQAPNQTTLEMIKDNAPAKCTDGRVEKWMNGVMDPEPEPSPGSAPLSLPSPLESSPPVCEEGLSITRLLIRWEGIPCPYRKWLEIDISQELMELLEHEMNEKLPGMVLRRIGTDHLEHGDLEIWMGTGPMCERLVYNSEKWLPSLFHGDKARIVTTKKTFRLAASVSAQAKDPKADPNKSTSQKKRSNRQKNQRARVRRAKKQKTRLAQHALNQGTQACQT
ncbi:hypothetical protein ASPZODRAFT_128137 [Penicilliopsis zonata CBS 506.65]|uniref:Uncharacterized protein n=1 Tax=Penicilliopsis zonata CBS 506.65 TaxID=1073090 RepID=A0A1L9SR90_9EURO|nr:hypothetical protein ASPZODRAFT_128137 [Penicilliopsis zonata CBS 506.65]OJJ49643.1 hypothetical protein ASPZODRAFT_128137 [Penicilliopsis zonata CBS 506.65]